MSCREEGPAARATGPRRRLPICLLALLALGGCGFLPAAGPSAGAVASQAQLARQVRLVEVTPELAQDMLVSDKQSRRRRLAAQLTSLEDGTQVVPVRLYPGDTADVSLWTEPAPAAGAGGSAIRKVDLGQYTVDGDGQLVLPYAGAVAVAGLTVSEAEQNIAASFAGLHRFAEPQVSLTIARNRHQHIVVTGAANRPVIVDWKTGGVSLSDAITEAGGYKGDALTTNQVVIRRGTRRFDLSMKTALETSVPLYPGDVVILEHNTAVRVQCLGGGWTKNTLQSFDDTPTLAVVVASGGGLSAQVAEGEAVYVLSRDHRTVYRIPWDTLAGLEASQSFPVGDGDTVYIATSPSVEFQQVVGILYSAAYPIATFNAVR